MKSIYIAGPITGIRAYRERFCEAEEWLTGMGWAVINPARLPIGLKPDQYMPICLAMLQAADAICLLPGWENSRGAKLERAFADYQGKEIFEGVAGVPNLKWEADTSSGPAGHLPLKGKAMPSSGADAPPSPRGKAFGNDCHGGRLLGDDAGMGEGIECDGDSCPIKP